MVLVFGITQGCVRIKRPLSHRNALKFDMCADLAATDEEFPVTVRTRQNGEPIAAWQSF